MFPQANDAFLTVGHCPASIDAAVLAEIEKHIVILYIRACPHKTVNEARRYLFSQGTSTLENVPPTQDALSQHLGRATYQGGNIWGHCIGTVSRSSTVGMEARWYPIWTSLPDACKEFVSCGCNPNKGCHKLCKCNRASLECTELWKCRSGCK